MKRRALLFAVPAACAVPPPRSARLSLLGLFEDPARARVLGRAYLAALPIPPDPEALAASVMDGIPAKGWLRTEVAALIRADYAASRIECLEGWLLSLTEARLCAIAALA